MSLDFRPLASSSLGCAYELSGGGASAPLLIDCGLRFEEIQRALNFRTSSLAGCLVSHSHGDHVKAAPDLMREGIDCYASLPTWVNAPKVDPTHYRARLLTPQVQAQVGDWAVLPFEVPHDCAGTLGFYIGSPDGSRALYLTDAMYFPHRFEGLTHLFVECNFSAEILKSRSAAGGIDDGRFKRVANTHMSIERLEDGLRANDLSGVEEIWLLHLSAGNSDEVAFADRIRRLTGKPVYVAAERTSSPLQEAVSHG